MGKRKKYEDMTGDEKKNHRSRCAEATMSIRTIVKQQMRKYECLKKGVDSDTKCAEDAKKDIPNPTLDDDIPAPPKDKNDKGPGGKPGDKPGGKGGKKPGDR